MAARELAARPVAKSRKARGSSPCHQTIGNCRRATGSRGSRVGALGGCGKSPPNPSIKRRWSGGKPAEKPLGRPWTTPCVYVPFLLSGASSSAPCSSSALHSPRARGVTRRLGALPRRCANPSTRCPNPAKCWPNHGRSLARFGRTRPSHGQRMPLTSERCQSIWAIVLLFTDTVPALMLQCVGTWIVLVTALLCLGVGLWGVALMCIGIGTLPILNSYCSWYCVGMVLGAANAVLCWYCTGALVVHRYWSSCVGRTWAELVSNLAQRFVESGQPSNQANSRLSFASLHGCPGQLPECIDDPQANASW